MNGLVKANLKCRLHSLTAKLTCGILLADVETARCTRVKRELRHCKVCNLATTENEYHFLFSCPHLRIIRSSRYLSCVDDFESFVLMEDKDKVKWFMQRKNMKYFGDFVEMLYDALRATLYRYNDYVKQSSKFELLPM